MDQVDLVGQTSEFARVFGIEFYHVLSRGSQVGENLYHEIFITSTLAMRQAKVLKVLPINEKY